ncbi:MAG: enoate reductase [Clostridia bacterium]|nr:enoate reductase [Clostridia bacterium]
MDDKYQKQIKEIIDHLGDWFNDDEKLKAGKMTANLYPYEKLFEPIQINRLKVKNRIVMGPMGNASMADETGKPGSKMIQYFIERAKGGAGLITSGMTPVGWGDDPSYEDLDATGIFPRLDGHRTVYSGWRAIVEGCHAYGARFFIQLAPGVGRVGSPECLTKKIKLPVSSSWNPNWYIPQIPCRPLTNRECRKIIKHTGQVALDAKEMGVDGIYLHGHSGYLLEQMTDPAFNRRKLGRYANWQNFGLDLVSEIRKRCGNAYPIHYRIDLSLGLNETYKEKMHTEKILKKFRNGRTADMTLKYMENLVKTGVDIFDVDLGGYDNWWMPHPPNGMPPGVYLAVSEMVKHYFAEHHIKSNAGLPVPIIAVGKLGYPDLAEQALRENKCDMVMLARPLLADPFWPQKAYCGRVNEIIPCIGDHEGCLGQFANGGHIHCAVNPRTGFEDIYKADLPAAMKEKRIAVVGAGPAGVVFACTAAQRGHIVTLYDKNDKAGGMLLTGSVPKIKYDMQNYMDYLNNEISCVDKMYNLKTRYNTNVTEEDLQLGDFDAVVICTGSKPVQIPIDGINQSHVVSGLDFLKNPSSADKAQDIVVIGGSDVGCEIAYMLSYEMNKNVTIVEMQPYFMKKTCTSNRFFTIYHLNKRGIKLMNCSKLKRINPKSVELLQNVSKTIPDPYKTWIPVLPDNIVNPFQKPLKNEERAVDIKADLVILCTGSQPEDSLFESCVRKHIAPEVHNLGDAFMVGRVLEAVKAGYALGTFI